MTFIQATRVNRDRKFDFLDELFDEAEFDRLVSFSKDLGDTATHKGSTLSTLFGDESFPQEFGDYTLIRLLGKGKTGSTYLAHKRDSHLEFVVKKIEINPVGVSLEELQKRASQFRKEIAAVAAIDSELINTTFEVDTFDDQLFYSAEYIEGKNLAKLVNANTLSNRRSAKVARAIAISMSPLHRAGVFHRDLCPSNILLDRKNRPRVLATGASLFCVDGAGNSRPSTFQAPELNADFRRTDRSAEIWSLGAILYNCLAGEPPRKSGHKGGLLAPRKINARVARDLETICMKCLRTKPEQRYRDMLELAEDLERFLEYQPGDAMPDSLLGKLISKISRLG